MSAFISSTWQATNARIPDTGVSVPIGQLPSMVSTIIENASPATAVEAQRVLQSGGELNEAAAIELAALTVGYARERFANRR